jgi:hypothetical protein
VFAFLWFFSAMHLAKAGMLLQEHNQHVQQGSSREAATEYQCSVEATAVPSLITQAVPCTTRQTSHVVLRETVDMCNPAQ